MLPESVTLTDITVLRCTACRTPRLRPWSRRPCSHCGADEVDEVVPTSFAVVLATLEPPDEYQAAEVLFHLRFGGAWQCACGHRRCTHLRTRPRLFSCNACDLTFSVTAGTSLHRCRVPLVKVVVAARLIAGDACSTSARRLARELDLGLETAWALGHRLRSGFLDLSPARLEPPVALSTVSVRRRPLPRRKRPFRDLEWYTRFTVLWDRNLRVVQVPGVLDPHSARRFVDTHVEVDKPALVWPVLLEDPRRIANHTHRGITDRWMPLYAASIVGWQNALVDGELPHVATLQATLRSERFPFARLRPKDAPYPNLQVWALPFDQQDDMMVDWGRWEPRPTRAPEGDA